MQIDRGWTTLNAAAEAMEEAKRALRKLPNATAIMDEADELVEGLVPPISFIFDEAARLKRMVI